MLIELLKPSIVPVSVELTLSCALIPLEQTDKKVASQSMASNAVPPSTKPSRVKQESALSPHVTAKPKQSKSRNGMTTLTHRRIDSLVPFPLRWTDFSQAALLANKNDSNAMRRSQLALSATRGGLCAADIRKTSNGERLMRPISIVLSHLVLVRSMRWLILLSTD